MTVQGIPVGGLKKVGQIVATNPLTFDSEQNGLAIAVALLSTHTTGAPVVDEKAHYVGFINEFDVLKVLDAGKDVSKLTAEQIMRKDYLTIPASTNIAEAVKIMEDHSVLSLPVEQDGKVAYSVSRHDLLRAWIGLGVGMGLDP